MEERKSAAHFLEMIKRSRRGKFKLYIGMSAGVGKTYRMLQEAHLLLKNGIQVKIGYIETHGRAETHDLLLGLPEIARRKLFYKGKELEEMDVDAILKDAPELVLVDELAHTNIHGSKNEKRWQDVLEILAAGINVISAVNIQHLESLHPDILHITGVDVAERIPDRIIAQADEVVNIDLTAEELIDRLKEGKIYKADKIKAALDNFFKVEHILQLRELALKEVASQVQRKVESEIGQGSSRHNANDDMQNTIDAEVGALSWPMRATRYRKKERLLACISINEKTARNIIRKTARLAGYYQSQWYVLYVQLPKERVDRISLAKHRHLINNFKLATELGAEVIKLEGTHIAREIMKQCELRQITTVCIGKPHLSLFKIIMASDTFRVLLNKLTQDNRDLIILS